jgi:hypothetical protein
MAVAFGIRHSAFGIPSFGISSFGIRHSAFRHPPPLVY